MWNNTRGNLTSLGIIPNYRYIKKNTNMVSSPPQIKSDTLPTKNELFDIKMKIQQQQYDNLQKNIRKYKGSCSSCK